MYFIHKIISRFLCLVLIERLDGHVKRYTTDKYCIALPRFLLIATAHPNDERLYLKHKLTPYKNFFHKGQQILLAGLSSFH